jgi:D-alanine-D-alanine ligase
MVPKRTDVAMSKIPDQTARAPQAVAAASQKPTVALLCGGNSSEREVSLASAANVEQVLTEGGYKVIRVDSGQPHFFKAIAHAQADVAFIALHGKGGEDGCIQGALELMGIPYTGSGVLASALAMDKIRSKAIYVTAGLDTPRFIRLNRLQGDGKNASPAQIVADVGLPCVVKPAADGSSVGISIVREQQQLDQALDAAFAQGADVLVESYIAGTEITVPVLGGFRPKVLPAIEIIPKNEFYDYASKYDEGGSRHIVPARISNDAEAAASSAAMLAHDALGCYGVSRTDMIIDASDRVWVIETNTIPGMTATSLLPDAAAHIGISNLELYELFIQYALERG